jgi:hypothetical protein
MTKLSIERLTPWPKGTRVLPLLLLRLRVVASPGRIRKTRGGVGEARRGAEVSLERHPRSVTSPKSHAVSI